MQDKIDIKDDWLKRIAPCPSIVWRSRSPKIWTDSRRIIYDHELMLFGPEGTFEIEFGNACFHLGPHHFIIIPPGHWHSCRGTAHDALSRAWMHFDWTWHADTPDAPIMTYAPASPDFDKIKHAPPYVPEHILHGPIQEPSIIFEIHERLRQRYNYGSHQEKLEARAMALEILIRLLGPLESHTKQNIPSHPMQQLRQDLERLANSPFAETPSVREYMQKKIGRNHDYLAREFKKTYGVTPLTFVNSLRMERARDLLRDTDLTIRQIADSLGFHDPVYFARLFRNLIRNSPTEIRKNLQKKQ